MAETEVAEYDAPPSWFRSKVTSLLTWKKTSLAVLASVEHKILSWLKLTPECKYVRISNGTERLWTVALNTRGAAASATPLVLLHGLGSGVALWALNLDALARDRPVYAIDMLGFGRSTRVRFSTEADEAEKRFIDSIEDWRQSVGIDSMILLGHSFGGYLAASYALHHADRVKHLILVDPWGFPEVPPDIQERFRANMPVWVKLIRSVVMSFSPFTAVRVAGPFGPSLISRFRGDLVAKYSSMFDDKRIAEYIYHCNAQSPSGELAFKHLSDHYGRAKMPMLHRVGDIDRSVSMTMMYGAQSWIDYGIGYDVRNIRKDSFVDVKVLQGASHHVYADQFEIFNQIVSKTCSLVDRTHTGIPGSLLAGLHPSDFGIDDDALEMSPTSPRRRKTSQSGENQPRHPSL